jgi:hypothetical protein
LGRLIQLTPKCAMVDELFTIIFNSQMAWEGNTGNIHWTDTYMAEVINLSYFYKRFKLVVSFC